MSESAVDAFRWQTFFQHAAQPIFLLNRRRRVLFVNRAWESATGLTLVEVRGRVCRRRSATASVDKDEKLLSLCAPPVEAMAGKDCNVRRRVPGGASWWDIHFLPLMGPGGLLGILGAVQVLSRPTEPPFSLPEKLMALRDRAAARNSLDALRQPSARMLRLFEQAKLAAQTNLPVTLLGEAGTGKQWLARAIHAASDSRRGYFACLDAERVPAALLADTLFGSHAAKPGLATVYLREPANLPREWQARLAETLQTRENPTFPRIIVGMRNDPAAEIQAGRLLEEFHCTVSAVTIAIPPLRDRLDEMPLFIDQFLRRARELRPHSIQSVSPEAIAPLRAHAWPGNLRELQQVVNGACARAKGEQIELADLPFFLKQGIVPSERRLPLDTLLEQVERRLIALALRFAHDNQTKAAEMLEIWRPRLMRRMEKLGFKPNEE